MRDLHPVWHAEDQEAVAAAEVLKLRNVALVALLPVVASASHWREYP